MRFFFIPLIVFLVSSYTGYSQIEKNTTQIGLSALPIFDVLNFFPKNDISGVAALGSVGYFPLKNFCVGINPHYSMERNSYNNYLFPYGHIRQQERIKFYGLNVYLKYYLLTKGKFAVFPMGSIGFGNMEKSIFNTTNNIHIESTNASVLMYFAGAGLNYFVTKKIALELNILYINAHLLSDNVSTSGFRTMAPTLGVQFYLK